MDLETLLNVLIRNSYFSEQVLLICVLTNSRACKYFKRDPSIKPRVIYVTTN